MQTQGEVQCLSTDLHNTIQRKYSIRRRACLLKKRKKHKKLGDFVGQAPYLAAGVHGWRSASANGLKRGLPLCKRMEAMANISVCPLAKGREVWYNYRSRWYVYQILLIWHAASDGGTEQGQRQNRKKQKKGAAGTRRGNAKRRAGVRQPDAGKGQGGHP